MIKIRYEDEELELEIVAKELDGTLTLSGFIEQLIKPLLLGIGYSHSMVERIGIFDEED